MKLSDCIPSNKADTTAIENAASIGYPSINSILPELLEWTKDGNWPVAKHLFNLLANAGPEIAPYIQTIFDGNDSEWKYFTLSCLVRGLRSEVAALLKPTVMRIAQAPSANERTAKADEAARDVLAYWSSLGS